MTSNHAENIDDDVTRVHQELSWMSEPKPVCPLENVKKTFALCHSLLEKHTEAADELELHMRHVDMLEQMTEFNYKEVIRIPTLQLVNLGRVFRFLIGIHIFFFSLDSPEPAVVSVMAER